MLTAVLQSPLAQPKMAAGLVMLGAGNERQRPIMYFLVALSFGSDMEGGRHSASLHVLGPMTFVGVDKDLQFMTRVQ